jgi:hypothetical protein
MAPEPARPLTGSARSGEPARSGTIAEVCRELWQIEDQLGLIEASASGVHWWPPMRVETFYRLTRALGLFHDPQPKASRRKPPGWRKLVDQARATWIDPVRPGRRARYLVFPHERKVDRGNGPVDIYTERLCRELAPEETLIVDRAASPRANGSAHLSFERLKATIRARERHDWRPLPEEQRRFRALEEALARAFGARVPIARIAPRRVRTFMAARQVYGKLLDRLGTESVFVVVGYFKHALNAAAHDRGIQVHEFQHAAISPYSLGYSYPGRPHVPYSPDTLLCFGPFWTSAPELPANTKPVVVGRTGALDVLLARAPPKRSRQVVVISQGVIGVELLQLAVRAARLAPDYQFVFRRHPGEIEADLRAILSRVGLECPANLAIVGSDPPFYDSLAESEVQVGVFSTGLFEGMLLGCRTIVADLSGSEAMETVVRRGDAMVVGSPEDLVATLAAAPAARAHDYYAEPADSIRQLLARHGHF